MCWRITQERIANVFFGPGRLSRTASKIESPKASGSGASQSARCASTTRGTPRRRHSSPSQVSPMFPTGKSPIVGRSVLTCQPVTPVPV